MNFIYVKEPKTIRLLQDKGYKLLKVTESGIHIFINKSPTQLEFKNNSEITYSDQITL